jgi:AAA domain/UvrD-like helicase C-terminal domain
MALAIKVALSDDFLRCFAALPRDRQQAAMQFISKFRANPMSPGINYEKINNAADTNLRSVRVDQNYRAIVLKPEQGNVYCVLWLDKHDDAYDWARRHRAAVHPDAGTLQVYEVTQHASDAVQQTAPIASGVFDRLKDRELSRLGVPGEAIASVRAIKTEDQLDSLQTKLPDDAFESLYLYAAGDTYEELVREREAPASVDTLDFATALDRDSTRRHFVVITDDRDLQDLLSAPLAMWRVFLHPSQRKLVDRDWNGPVRVLGGAGTGKTVVAMHRAVWLARKYMALPGKPVLLTTFTRTLANDLESQVAMIATQAEREKIEIVNLDQWAKGVLHRLGYRQELLFDERKRRELWNRAMTRKPDDVEQPNSFFRAEYERVVLPQGCASAEDYAKASRIGRGVQLSRPARALIWPVFAEYRAQLRGANLREPEEAYRDALTLMEKEKIPLGIRSIVVDETQDLSAAALALLRAAVQLDTNDLFVVGDAHQRIYRHRVTLSKVGIDIRGRGRRLRINYRTTDEIRRWAAARLADCTIDDLDGQPDTLSGYKSLTHGAVPHEVVSASREEERAIISRTLELLATEGIAPDHTCLVVRSNEEAIEYADWLAAIGRSALRLDRSQGDDDSRHGIRVSTMHRVKGLEFDAVLIVGYRGPEALAQQFAEDLDAGVLVDTLTSERCLLHVAATRARRYLLVSSLSTG